MVNTQHDCLLSCCNTTGTQFLTQEREATTQTRSVVEHKDKTHFIVNTHALHNHQYIRLAIPESLRQIPCFFPDRRMLHLTAAASLRDQKLQRKLAKEATAREQAEDARSRMIPSDLMVEGEVQSLDISIEAEVPMMGSESNTRQIRPRGPRGRHITGSKKGSQQGRGRAAMHGSALPAISSEPVAGSSVQSMDGQASPESVVGAIPMQMESAPPQARKRKRAGADPLAAAARARNLRFMFAAVL